MSEAFVMPNGRHKGKSIEHVPVGYLKWMVNEHHTQAGWAESELKRRGTTFPNLDISGHAINRASLCCKWEYRETRNENEGLHSWLVRMAEAALERGIPRPGHEGQYALHGMSFRFTTEHEWPVLKTVLPIGKRRRERKMDAEHRLAISTPAERGNGEIALDPDDVSGNVAELISGANTGATIWALRLQVKRDQENAVDQQKLVPYGVVLAYCEQVGAESVVDLETRMEQQRATLVVTRILCGFLAVGLLLTVVSVL